MNVFPKESIYRLLVEQSPDLLWAKDRQGRYLYVNRTICEKLLIAENTQEPLGKTDLYFAERQRALFPDNPHWHTFGELCVDSDQVVLQSGRGQRFDEFGNVQGKFLYIDVYKTPLWDENSELVGTVGSGRIVTREHKEQGILRQREAHFQPFAENSEDLFFRLDPAGGVTYLSPACRALFGIEREQLHGTFYLNSIVPDDHALAEKSFAELLNGKSGERMLLQVYDLQRRTLWVEVHAAPYYDQSGIAGVQGRLRDVSERKRHEEQLHLFNQRLLRMVDLRTKELYSSTQLLQNVLNTAAAGIGIVSQHCFSYVNDTMEEISGYGVEELVGLEWKTLLATAEDEQVIDRLVSSSSAVERADAAEIRWRRKDGRLCTVLLDVQPIFHEEGAAGDLLFTAFDITSAKQMESERAKAYNELNQIFNVAIPFCLLSTECRIIRVNQAFCDYLGMGEADILGKSGRNVWQCNSCSDEKCYIKRFSRGVDRIVDDIEFTLNGRVFVCAVHGVPYRNTEDRLKGIILNFLDTSAQKKIAQDLEHTQRQLIQAEKLSAVGALAASITHEFNNPVCGIKNVLQRVLRKELLDEKESALMQMARDECARLEQMVRELQNVCVPPTAEKTVFDLHAMLTSVALLAGKYLQQSNVLLKQEYQGALPVVAAEDQVKQVCILLILSSIKWMATIGGEIVLSTCTFADHLQLSITCTGPDMGAHLVTKMFQQPESLHSSDSGSGLAGVSIAQSMVRDHGGDVQVQAVSESTAVIKLLLPASLGEGEPDE